MNSWKRTFAIIWSGQLLSILSSYTVGYSIIFWLSIETKSPEVLALAAIASLMPQSVLGMFTGVYIDRWNRKRVMILADCFIAFATFILIILFFFGKVQPWHIYFLAAARSVGAAFHMPAMQASVPLLAPESQLMRIAGINQMIQSISSIGGPALGALLIVALDMKFVLMIDIFGAAVAVISLMMVHIPNPVKVNEEIKKPHVFRELKEGLNEVYKDRGLTLLMFFSVISMFFIMPIAVLFPLMTLNHFNGGVMQMSIVEIFWGAGMLAGGALAGVKKVGFNKALVICYMYLIFGLTFFFSGVLSHNAFVWFVVLTAIGGISSAIYNASFTSLLQIKINPAMLGRVFSTYMSITLFPSMLGLLGTGFIAEHLGLVNAFIICGIINLLIGIISLVIPSIKKTGE